MPISCPPWNSGRPRKARSSGWPGGTPPPRGSSLGALQITGVAVRTTEPNRVSRLWNSKPPLRMPSNRVRDSGLQEMSLSPCMRRKDSPASSCSTSPMKPYSLPVKATSWSSIAEKVSADDRPTSMPRCSVDSTASICAWRATVRCRSVSAASDGAGGASPCPGPAGTSPGDSIRKPDIRSPRIRKHDKRAS